MTVPVWPRSVVRAAMDNASSVEAAAAALKTTLPVLKLVATRHQLGAMYDRIRRGGENPEAAHPGFKDETGNVFCDGAVSVLRRAPNAIGNARWRVRFNTCGHEHTYQGIRLRVMRKTGKAPVCPVCKAEKRKARAS